MFTSAIGGKKTLSVMLTHACPAECKNCGTLSSPRARESISLEDVKRHIEEAWQHGDFGIVVFTGGEATLRWKDLLESIRYATALGFPTRLVTNAHWALNEELANTKLQKLLDAGLVEINFSTGDEHARFIPTKRVAIAAACALKKNLPVHIVIECTTASKITKETFFSDPALDDLSNEELRRLTLNENPWMPLDPYEIESYRAGMVNDESSVHQPCDVVLNTYTLQGDGRVGACCGLGMRKIPALNIGSIQQSLSSLRLNAESDLVKLAIHYFGPLHLIKWASETDPTIEWKDMYAHHCQACARLYKDDKVIGFISDHIDELKQKVEAAYIFDEGFGEKFINGL
jgi:organic radical activating enzyme